MIFFSLIYFNPLRHTLAHLTLSQKPVVPAKEADIDEVFTLDMRGFQAYRIHGKNHLRFGRDSYWFRSKGKVHFIDTAF